MRYIAQRVSKVFYRVYNAEESINDVNLPKTFKYSILYKTMVSHASGYSDV